MREETLLHLTKADLKGKRGQRKKKKTNPVIGVLELFEIALL